MVGGNAAKQQSLALAGPLFARKTGHLPLLPDAGSSAEAVAAAYSDAAYLPGQRNSQLLEHADIVDFIARRK